MEMHQGGPSHAVEAGKEARHFKRSAFARPVRPVGSMHLAFKATQPTVLRGLIVRNRRAFMRASAIFITLFPAIAHAEVMDKELSLTTLLGIAIVGALVAFVMARHKPWLLAMFLPVMALFLAAHIAEVTNPYVGPALAAEAGGFYIFVSWAAPVLVLLGGSIGLALRRFNSKANAGPP